MPSRLEHVRALNGIDTYQDWWERIREPAMPESEWWPSYAAVRNYHHKASKPEDLRLAPAK